MASQTPPADLDLARLASRLRRMRGERHLTLEQLAAESGLSTPYLSRLESAERQPSLAALFSLARALGVPVAALFADHAAGDDVIVRSADVPIQHGTGLHYKVVSRRSGRPALQAIRVTVPVDREPGGLFEHVGEEWLYVLSGRLRFTLGETVHLIDAGDAAHYDASIPHRLAADGDEDVELLLVCAAIQPDLLATLGPRRPGGRAA